MENPKSEQQRIVVPFSFYKVTTKIFDFFSFLFQERRGGRTQGMVRY